MLTSSSTTRTRSGEPSARVRSDGGAELIAPACWCSLCVSCEEAGRARGLDLRPRTGSMHRCRTGRRAMVVTMSDTEPTAVQPDEAAAQPTARERAAAQTPLRDHLFGLRSVLAVGLAGVVIGGLGGFGL